MSVDTSRADVFMRGLERVSGPQNDNLDIDFLDDERVDVDVAILDTGIELHNSDLNVVAGVDCLGATAPAYTCQENDASLSGPEGDDSHGHGTGAAGIIGGLDNQLETGTIGVFGGVWSDTGVAPGARLWAVDVTPDGFFPTGSWTESVPYDLDPLIAGVKWVTAHADQIEAVNMGIGCTTDPTPSLPQPVCTTSSHESLAEAIDALQDAISESTEEGVVYATPAGNWYTELDPDDFEEDLTEALDPEFEGAPFSRGPHFVPAILDDVITVSAVVDTDGIPGGKGSTQAKCVKTGPGDVEQDQDDTNAASSHYGPGVEVAAPGGCTSGASPHVVGAAAVLASMKNPNSREGVEEIREDLFGGSDCSKPSTKEPDVGTGSCDWIDVPSVDGIKEPLLDVGNESVFNPKTVQGTYPAPVDPDVNGDGHADLVTLRANGVVHVHPGGANLKFASSTTSFSGKPLNPAQYDGKGEYVVDVADVNGDKRSDLVTLTDEGDVDVYRGQSGKTFEESAVTSALGLTPGLLSPDGHEPIAVADVNGDSYGDLIAHDDKADAVMAYLGSAGGTFSAGAVARAEIPSALHSGLGHYFIDAADVTGDGRADLVTMTSTDDLNVFAGQNGGTFAAPTVSYKGQIDPAMDDAQGYEPLGLGDVTGDGKADLALVKAGTVYVYPGKADAGLGSAVENFGGVMTSTTFGSGVGELIGMADVNKDGHADLFGVNSSSKAPAVTPGQANGAFGTGVASEGTFLSTQHGANQNSNGNEFVSEKPSWRRRGCDARGCGWVIDAIFNPPAGNSKNSQTGVSCTSATFCFASGVAVSTAGTTWSYGSVWDGSAWTHKGGVPSNEKTAFNDVSCSSPTSCMAVGERTEAGGKVVNFSSRWSGSAWTNHEVFNPPVGTSKNRQTGVSCTSATFCFASGVALSTGGTSWSYGSVWDGSAWTHKGSVPSNENTAFNDVSCSSPTSCMAVGEKTNANGTFVVRWNGTTWASQSVPDPQSGDNSLTAVSCTSSTFCFAVGHVNISGIPWSYGAAWNGSTWEHEGWIPSNEKTKLSGVSCTSPTSCMAVGERTVTGGVDNFAVRWDGADWTSHYTPDKSASNRLASVSCASRCVAVGSFTEGAVTSNLGLHSR